jgi:hypothetical protein
MRHPPPREDGATKGLPQRGLIALPTEFIPSKSPIAKALRRVVPAGSSSCQKAHHLGSAPCHPRRQFILSGCTWEGGIAAASLLPCAEVATEGTAEDGGTTGSLGGRRWRSAGAIEEQAS